MFNILVVENDAKLGNIYSTILKMNHYNPFIACSGQAALDILTRII